MTQRRQPDALMAVKYGAAAENSNEILHPKEGDMSTSRLFGLLVALALAVVAVMTVRAAVATSNLVNSGTIDAAAARWQGLGEFYVRQAQETARIQRAQAADTARWVAMAKAYKPSSNVQSAQP